MSAARGSLVFSPYLFWWPVASSVVPLVVLISASGVDPIDRAVGLALVVAQGMIPLLGAAVVLYLAHARLGEGWAARPLIPYAVLAVAYAIGTAVMPVAFAGHGDPMSSSALFGGFFLGYLIAVVAMPALALAGGLWSLYRSGQSRT